MGMTNRGTSAALWEVRYVSALLQECMRPACPLKKGAAKRTAGALQRRAGSLQPVAL